MGIYMVDDMMFEYLEWGFWTDVNWIWQTVFVRNVIYTSIILYE